MKNFLDYMPQREPFLFVDRVVEITDSYIKTEKQVKADEPFFAGHFPGRPIMPGVLICEAVFQSSSVLMSKRAEISSNDDIPVDNIMGLFFFATCSING